MSHEILYIIPLVPKLLPLSSSFPCLVSTWSRFSLLIQVLNGRGNSRCLIKITICALSHHFDRLCFDIVGFILQHQSTIASNRHISSHLSSHKSRQYSWHLQAAIISLIIVVNSLFLIFLLNTETYGVPAWTERWTRTRKTGKCTEGERCSLNVCVVPSLNGQVPFNLERERERDEREADKQDWLSQLQTAE